MGETAGKMKQFATWFTHGVPGGAKLRRSIYDARAGTEVLAEVDAFFQAQFAGGVESAPEPEDEGAQGFPEEAMVCD
jgi:hypothetical protein